MELYVLRNGVWRAAPHVGKKAKGRYATAHRDVVPFNGDLAGFVLAREAHARGEPVEIANLGKENWHSWTDAVFDNTMRFRPAQTVQHEKHNLLSGQSTERTFTLRPGTEVTIENTGEGDLHVHVKVTRLSRPNGLTHLMIDGRLYIVPDQHVEVFQAFHNGTPIEVQCREGTWARSLHPTWKHDAKYRVAVDDAYAELRAAQKAGKTIQWFSMASRAWTDHRPSDFEGFPPHRWRVKPEGKQWLAELQAARDAGKVIQVLDPETWSWLDYTNWGRTLSPSDTWRVKLEDDPFAELKAAHAKGARIEVKVDGMWFHFTPLPSWDQKNTYRLAPGQTLVKDANGNVVGVVSA